MPSPAASSPVTKPALFPERNPVGSGKVLRVDGPPPEGAMYRARGNDGDYQSDTRGTWSKLLTNGCNSLRFIEQLGKGRGCLSTYAL
jgi:hypothetical protein